MRAVLLCLTLSAFASEPAFAEMTKEQCALLSGPVNSGAAATSTFARVLGKSELPPLPPSSSENLSSAAAKTEAARKAAVPALKAYIEAMEDFAHQLRLCAR